MAQTAAESLIQQGKTEGIEQGIAQGIEQGKAEGILEGKREAVLRFLHSQFHNVPASIIQRITALDSISALDILFDQAMTAKSLDDLQV